MTDVFGHYGKYTKFSIKENGNVVAAVDRRDGKYVVYAGWPFLDEIGSRTKKDSAFRLAQDSVLRFIPDAEFKFNVIQERYR